MGSCFWLSGEGVLRPLLVFLPCRIGILAGFFSVLAGFWGVLLVVSADCLGFWFFVGWAFGCFCGFSPRHWGLFLLRFLGFLCFSFLCSFLALRALVPFEEDC